MPTESTTPNGGMGQMVSQVNDWFSQNPRLSKSLMAGLGSAAVGGGLTALSKRKNETRSERRKRILRNALLTGGAAAGAVGLGDYALGQLATVDPEPVDPVLGSARNFGAATGGGLMLAGGHMRGKMNEAKSRAKMLNNLQSHLENTIDKTESSIFKSKANEARTLRELQQGFSDPKGGFKGLMSQMVGSPSSSEAKLKELTKIDSSIPGSGATSFEKLLGEAGVTAQDKRHAGYISPFKGKGDTKRFVGDWFRRGLDRTLGTSNSQRAKRVGKIGAGAAIPYALISTLMSNPEMAENTLGKFKSYE